VGDEVEVYAAAAHHDLMARDLMARDLMARDLMARDPHVPQ